MKPTLEQVQALGWNSIEQYQLSAQKNVAEKLRTLQILACASFTLYSLR